VIERAAIMAAGADSAEVLAWIVAHAGEPEDAVRPAAGRGGLHGARADAAAAGASRTPRRYVLPPGTLS
jgi:hypothetical protein